LLSIVKDQRVAEFRELCAAKGLSVTHQRHVIYEALRGAKDHPSPEAVYEKVRKQIPSVSLATVYKNIKTFIDTGVFREVSLHHGSTRLETNMTPHHHLVCSNCKAIVDLADEDFEPVRLRRPAPRGYRIQRYSVEVVGLCPACAE
jgi:Fur family peroxide stress response transcriptional regulator